MSIRILVLVLLLHIRVIYSEHWMQLKSNASGNFILTNSQEISIEDISRKIDIDEMGSQLTISLSNDRNLLNSRISNLNSSVLAAIGVVAKSGDQSARDLNSSISDTGEALALRINDFADENHFLIKSLNQSLSLVEDSLNGRVTLAVESNMNSIDNLSSNTSAAKASLESRISNMNKTLSNLIHESVGGVQQRLEILNQTLTQAIESLQDELLSNLATKMSCPYVASIVIGTLQSQSCSIVSRGNEVVRTETYESINVPSSASSDRITISSDGFSGCTCQGSGAQRDSGTPSASFVTKCDPVYFDLSVSPSNQNVMKYKWHRVCSKFL